MKIGPKVHLSTDNIDIVRKLAKIYDFIEIYYTNHHLRNSAINKIFDRWVVHCPHTEKFINPASKRGINHIKSSILFAEKIKAKRAIVHPGFLENGLNKETAINNTIEIIRNLRYFAKKHKIELLVENLYPMSKHSENVKIGTNLEEMETILKGTGCGFLLDFPHAYCSSISYKEDYKKFIRDLYKIGPVMFHLYDGFIGREIDSHTPLGKGNLDIKFFLSFIKDEPVTLELDPPNLESHLNALEYLKKLGYDQQLGRAVTEI